MPINYILIDKARKVVESCDIAEQLPVAKKFVDLALKKAVSEIVLPSNHVKCLQSILLRRQILDEFEVYFDDLLLEQKTLIGG